MGRVSMAGFSAASKIQNIICTGICLFWGYHSHLCRSEPGAGKMGPCAERGIYDPGHDPGVQLCDHGSDLFPWEIIWC